jgi:tRNA dimethylallyltransferase
LEYVKLGALAKIPVPVLLGPTASGKSAIAQAVCERLGCDLLSCDSRQIYRRMDIGTAKPSPGDMARVRHWMVDIVDPGEKYSAFAFARDAGARIRERAAQGKRVMVCGGTGLYFQALCAGLGPQAPEDPALREKYKALAAAQGRQAVFDELLAADPLTAAASHASNLQRNIRALEVFHSTGRPLSELKKRAAGPEDIVFDVVVLSQDRETLYRRIDGRVDAMMNNGLLDEFHSLLRQGYDQRSPGLLCVGYREFFAFDKGEATLEQVVDKIKQDTRNYAKRQITWFRHQVRGREVAADPCACETVISQVKEFCGL